ncbi:TlpA disulfide reductase family protein [uncultured Abyssibacter sp.]|uniref:TlpA family protein disulfide reductase n=1 Tax=uncultured Abyssibacter sp. TaxID=2320202 RepID=UPI0032B1CF28
MKTWIPLILIAVAAAVGGFALQRLLQADTNTASAPDGPTALPTFSIPNLGGEPVTPDDFPGRTVLINFWATWCPPCRDEIPELIELQDQYGDEQLQILGIALDDRARVAEYAARMGMNYPVLVVEGAEGFDLMDAYGAQIGGLPFNVMIRPDGTVAMRHEGAVTRQEIESRL